MGWADDPAWPNIYVMSTDPYIYSICWWISIFDKCSAHITSQVILLRTIGSWGIPSVSRANNERREPSALDKSLSEPRGSCPWVRRRHWMGTWTRCTYAGTKRLEGNVLIVSLYTCTTLHMGSQKFTPGTQETEWSLQSYSSRFPSDYYVK